MPLAWRLRALLASGLVLPKALAMTTFNPSIRRAPCGARFVRASMGLPFGLHPLGGVDTPALKALGAAAGLLLTAS